MSENTELLSKLQQLLTHKKSRKYYAGKLNISEEEVEKLLQELRTKEPTNDLEKFEKSTKVNNDKGTLESSIEVNYEPKSDEELYILHKVDKTKYKISSYWSKLRPDGRFTSSILASLIKEDSKDRFQENFIEFLKDFKPSPTVIKNEYVSKKPKISLIFPKQDAHYNKLDIYGDNSIENRFTKDQQSVLNMLVKASATNYIDEVIYIVGSDQFNSEWTNLTTKGTPQSNILSYQGAFTLICNHEVEIITTLLHYSNKVKVIFIPGNHDEFVGWHLINWLESYFRNEKNTSFNSSIENTKYYRYGNSAIMLNHGDTIKPKDLAHKFPIGFRDKWSFCSHYYVFTGDKHHEMSLDIHGIKFYQIPQLSSAHSKWDDKQGYIDSKAEMTAFVITENNGMSDIYKEIL